MSTLYIDTYKNFGVSVSAERKKIIITLHC